LHNLIKLQPSFEVEVLLDIHNINQKIYLRNLSLRKNIKELFVLVVDRVPIRFNLSKINERGIHSSNYLCGFSLPTLKDNGILEVYSQHNLKASPIILLFI
jgi:hypothetical protein